MKVQELQNICSIKSGGTPSKNDKNLWGDHLPWITAKDMKMPVLRSSLLKLSKTGEGKAKTTPANSLLILVRGMTLFKDVPVCLAERELAFNQDIKALVLDEGIDPKYVLYFLMGSKHRLMKLVDSAGHGTGRLNTDLLKAFPILLPPLPEQKAIADLLATWDAAIEKTERLIEAKERRFRGLMQALMREKPGWRKVRIGSFLTESRIAGSNGLDAKKLTVKLYGNGVVAKNEKRLGSETTNYFLRRSGQFIYSKLDFLNGAFGVIPEELDGFESTLDLPAFDFSSEVCREWFLYFVTRPEYYTKQLGLAKGQRKARRVSPREFLGSKIPFPPIEEQRQVSEKLSLIEREITLEKQILEQYKAQKRGLMQKLLTGEWRVVASGAKNRKEGGRGA